MSTHNVFRMFCRSSSRRRRRLAEAIRSEVLEPRVLLATFTVLNTGDSGAGSLRQAILDANAAPGADAIAFDIADTDPVIAVGDQLVVTDDVTIDGTNLNAAGGTVTLDGGQAGRIAMLDGAVAVNLTEITLTNGSADGSNGGQRPLSGGAVLNQGATLTLDSVVITGNAASFGGGVFNDGGIVTVQSGTVSANTATTDGAGVYTGSSGVLTLTDSRVSNNHAGAFGGGIFNGSANPDGSVTIERSEVTQNTAGADGGALANFGGVVDVSASTISNNMADGEGAGLFNRSNGDLSIRDSTISMNTSATSGAGLYNSGTSLLVNSTVSGNSADDWGGGIYNAFGVVSTTNVTITGNRADADDDLAGRGGGIFAFGDTGIFIHTRNTIVAGNFVGPSTTPSDIAGRNVEPDSVHNLIGDNGTAGGLNDGVDGNIVGVDVVNVLNTSLGANGGDCLTHALVPGSPAIDGGSDVIALDNLGLPLGEDQRGMPFERIFAESVDIGAYEIQLRAVRDLSATSVNTPVHIPLIDNDEPDSQPIVTEIVTQPTHGTLSMQPDGSVDYSPAQDFVGDDEFVYEIQFPDLKESGGAGGTEAGHSIAIDGDWLVAGAPSEDLQNLNGGTASVYRRTGGVWSHFQTIESPDEAEGDAYGYDVAIDGDTLVVSARMDDDQGTNSGSIWVWEFDDGTNMWEATTKLVDPAGNDRDQFGHAVAISGDTIAVGARLDDGLGTNSGSVLIFARTGPGWVFDRQLKANDAQGGDQFGFDVALDGDLLAVTARKDDNAAVDAGAAYIFARDAGGTGNWGQVARVLPSVGLRNDWFGQSVDLEDDTLVVGKPIRNNRDRPGQVHVFRRDEGGADQWGESAVIQDSNATPNKDQFGYAVAIDGNRVLAGARRDDTAGPNAGAGYLFERASGSEVWTEVSGFFAADADRGDNRGRAVALNGHTIAFGAPFDDEGGSDAGALYVEDLRTSEATVSISVNDVLFSRVAGRSADQSLDLPVVPQAPALPSDLFTALPEFSSRLRDVITSIARVSPAMSQRFTPEFLEQLAVARDIVSLDTLEQAVGAAPRVLDRLFAESGLADLLHTGLSKE